MQGMSAKAANHFQTRILLPIFKILVKIKHDFAGSPEDVPSIMGLSPGPGFTVNGQCLISAWMLASWNLRPIRRLASNTVLMGFMATYKATTAILSEYHQPRQSTTLHCTENTPATAHLVLCCITDQTLGVCESNVGRRSAVSHVVGCNHTMQSQYSVADTTISRAEPARTFDDRQEQVPVAYR